MNSNAKFQISAEIRPGRPGRPGRCGRGGSKKRLFELGNSKATFETLFDRSGPSFLPFCPRSLLGLLVVRAI
jgi:hypothetical protein